MAKVTKEMEALRASLAAARTVRGTADSLANEHAAKVADRKRVTSSYPSPDEVVANARRLVAEQAQKWATEYGTLVVRECSGHMEQAEAGSSRQREVLPRLPAFGARESLDFPTLVGLVPELVAARLEAVIRGSGARFGPPAAERAAKLAELDAQIADIEQQHTALVAEAAEVGIALELLDVVRQRREVEAKEAERARQLADERSRGIYKVDGVSAGGASVPSISSR